MSKIEAQNSIIEISQVREGSRTWEWKCTLAIIYFTALVNGYDVSNVANIQPRLYETFGHIELLSWISISYSLALFSVMFLVRNLTYNFGLRWLYLGNLAIFLLGAAIAGSAQSMVAVILGRAIMGVGGAFVQQINMFYVSVCAPKKEMRKTPVRISTMSASWAVGLILGGPIGSAFSERVTWRMAFFINLPCVGATLILAYFCVPETMVLPDRKGSVLQRLRQLDWAPSLLNIAMPVLFALAVTLSGSLWHWDSRPVLGVWLSFGVVFLLWVLYLWLRVKWTGLLLQGRSKFSMCCLLVGSACAGASYAVSLYYFPLYFAFAKGADALEQTLWVLPFVLAFIASVAATGRLLHIAGSYRAIYAIGGAIIAATGVVLAVVLTPDTPRPQVAGLEVLMGIGVGLLFQHSIGICNALERSKNTRKRLDTIFMCNLAQMGAIPMTLAASWGIFQNVGYRRLDQTLGATLDEDEIRELLAGSSTKSHNLALLRKAANIVSTVIAQEFYIVAAVGVVGLMVGLLFLMCMWQENVDFKEPGDYSEGAAVVENIN